MKMEFCNMSQLSSKRLCKFYVATMIEICSDNVLSVKYLKKTTGNKCIYKDEKVYKLQIANVVMELPASYVTDGTKRRS